MDRRTLAAYEAAGSRWARRRPPSPDLIRLAGWVAAHARPGVRVDLGCGTGAYLATLGPTVVALDAAGAMVQAAVRSHPAALGVRADLEAPPFRRGALAAAWARASYLHLPPERLPLALARLHDALRPGAPFAGTMLAGEPGWGEDPGGDFPGRWFARWRPTDLAGTLVGAGFAVEDLRVDDPWISFRARRAVTLPDYVAPGLRLLVVGVNPSPTAAATGVPFGGPRNRFWTAARRAGLVPGTRDPWVALRAGIGFTDLAKRPTPRAATLRVGELRDGLARVERLVRRHAPRAVCVAGVGVARRLLGADGAGPLGRRIGGRPTYVMPNPSGANAATGLDALVAHLGAACGAHGPGRPAPRAATAPREGLSD